MTNLMKLTTGNLPDFYKTTVGFDRLFDEVERRFQNSVQNGYPPYNIVKLNDNEYVIELAVAGFTDEDITVEIENSMLTVEANVVDVENPDVTYIHKGIASRSFKRQFQVADTVEVVEATMKNGMLSIHLENIIPEAMKPRQIKINTRK